MFGVSAVIVVLEGELDEVIVILGGGEEEKEEIKRIRKALKDQGEKGLILVFRILPLSIVGAICKGGVENMKNNADEIVEV